MLEKVQRKGKGSITQEFRFWKWVWPVTIIGGPFAGRSADQFGICLLERKTNDPDVWLPIRDFSVPDDQNAVREAIKQAMVAALQGREVYVGCMAGQGRTGLFLSLVAKAFGVENPVEYVRNVYYPHAVETKPQYDYVMKFDTDGLYEAALREYVRSWLAARRLGWLTPLAMRFA